MLRGGAPFGPDINAATALQQLEAPNSDVVHMPAELPELNVPAAWRTDKYRLTNAQLAKEPYASAVQARAAARLLQHVQLLLTTPRLCRRILRGQATPYSWIASASRATRPPRCRRPWTPRGAWSASL